MILRYAHKYKVAMPGNGACFLPAVFLLKKKDQIFSLNPNHAPQLMRRCTARASSLCPVFETITSMEG